MDWRIELYALGTKCFRCHHARGEHDESECRGGEDVRCRCDCFEEPEEECARCGERYDVDTEHLCPTFRRDV